MKVVVLAGGISAERDVSLISGKMIYQAMKRLGDIRLSCWTFFWNGTGRH